MTSLTDVRARSCTPLAQLGRRTGRRVADATAAAFVCAAFVLAVIPLVLVLYFVISKGASHVNGNFLTHSMAFVTPNQPGGGAYHAIIGTVEQVGLATLISVPFGLLVAIYISEYGRGRLRTAIRFFVDVMTGVPSIVAGLFIYAFWVLGLHRGFSGFAGALALAVLMLPIVVRSREEMLLLVPVALREASYALGIPRWRTVLRVVLPTASAGITTRRDARRRPGHRRDRAAHPDGVRQPLTSTRTRSISRRARCRCSSTTRRHRPTNRRSTGPGPAPSH